MGHLSKIAAVNPHLKQEELVQSILATVSQSQRLYDCAWLKNHLRER